MSMLRAGLLIIIFVLLPAVTSAQTKESAKKAPATASSSSMIVEPGSEKWGDVPAAAMVGTPSVEMGGTVRVAVLQGDPMTAGHAYTLRLSCTDGTKIAPHWHPTTENVTVIKGTAAVGMGSKWDDAALKDVSTGGFFWAAPHMKHFAQCKGDTILQVHGIAPFVLNFIGPGDSQPAKKPK
ncbi:MAG TPA: cupin domain-containing protein [Candidatus Acidoferrales bacterium]|nr:cupin domain-containing protein [Candidatus Acidoferrales bacterium]